MPAHFSPFQAISLRLGSHGLPSGVHEARLYRMRRLVCQGLMAQPGCCPADIGIVGGDIWLPALRPASPRKSSRRSWCCCRRAAGQSPAVARPFWPVWSGLSVVNNKSSARPFISLASSSGVGFRVAVRPGIRFKSARRPCWRLFVTARAGANKQLTMISSGHSWLRPAHRRP